MSQSNRDPREYFDTSDARGTSRAVPLFAEKVALLEREFGVRDPQIMREVLMLLTRANRSLEEPEREPRSFNDPGQSNSLFAGFQAAVHRLPWPPHIDRNAPPLIVSSVIVPTSGEYTDPLAEVTSPAWGAIWSTVKDDWSKIYELPPERLEELVAASYAKDGFRVQLTPRSNDHGRDVIAIKDGIHGYKLIGSVKRYAERRLVGYDDVRALLGVMSGERDTSKGVLVTTSDFPPNIRKDPFIGPFLPTRLQLMNGDHLREWLEKLAKKKLDEGAKKP